MIAFFFAGVALLTLAAIALVAWLISLKVASVAIMAIVTVAMLLGAAALDVAMKRIFT